MKKGKNFDFKKMYTMLEEKKQSYFYHRFAKYIVDYRIEEDHIKVISNVGKYRIVKNTHSNLAKINRTIIKNKIAIANKIDEYEQTERERLLVILVTVILLCGSGMLVPISLFIGSYFFFLLSILLFSISVLSTTIIGMNYFLLVKEIQNLKKVTGYRKEMEFEFPQVSRKLVKGRN